MGFKTFTLFASDVPGYFGTQPAHDPAKAEELLRELGLSGYELIEEHVGLNDYPSGGDLYIGAYPNGVVIAHKGLVASLFPETHRDRGSGSPSNNPWSAKRLLALYPNGEVLALVLHSVVNWWGFSVHRKGTLVRCASGAEDQFYGSVGEPLPEELPLLKEHAIENVAAEVLGEDLVFDVSQRAFGWRYDEMDISGTLMCSHYRKQFLLKRLFKRFF